MSTFTLDNIREAAEAKYGHTDIEIGEETVRLRNALQLPKDVRKKLSATQEKLSEDEVDQEEVLAEILVLVAESKAKGEALIKAIGGNFAVLLQVFEAYNKGTQLGEASTSQD